MKAFRTGHSTLLPGEASHWLDLELLNLPPASTLQVLGLQEHATTPKSPLLWFRIGGFNPWSVDFFVLFWSDVGQNVMWWKKRVTEKSCSNYGWESVVGA